MAERRGILKIPNLTPSTELSYLLGVYYGDGSTSRFFHQGGYTHRIKLTVKDKDFIDEFNRCISLILQREDRYKIARLSDERYDISICNKLLYEFLNEPLTKHKTIIEEFPVQFLGGLFDSDGGVYFYNYKEGCRYHAMVAKFNLPLLEYVRELLYRRFSVHSTIKVVRKSGDKYAIHSHGRTHTGTSTKNTYRLNIRGKENVLNFCKMIRFSIQRKRRMRAKILNHFLSSKKELRRSD